MDEWNEVSKGVFVNGDWTALSVVRNKLCGYQLYLWVGGDEVLKDMGFYHSFDALKRKVKPPKSTGESRAALAIMGVIAAGVDPKLFKTY